LRKNIEQEAFPFRSVGITGATGTVAGQFQTLLLDRFPQVERITTTCRNPKGARAAKLPVSERFRVLDGGIHSVANLKAVADSSEVVYHLAAWLANTEMPGITEVLVANSLSTGVLARLCAERGVRLVFTSSHSVYFAGDYTGVIREDGFAFRTDFMDWIDAVEPRYSALADALIAGRTEFAEAHATVAGIHAEFPVPFQPKIYDNDSYHIYCLSKMLAERFVMQSGGVVLRLTNVYGPGDDSTQAVAEACQRLIVAEPSERIDVRQPFKRLVPMYMGDICRSFIRAASLDLPPGVSPLFTVASQDGYMREDELLRTVAACLKEDGGRTFDIETLPPEESPGFVYDLSKMHNYLLSEDEVTPFHEGVREHLHWLMDYLQAGEVRP
jgi:nucleoside-diphosphate-sugar epimerase